ncbi:uncharacterized protein Pyn_12665 [Prunus yedoensis var. nudiflora]|uniref:Uncharacterized protein n=1 Tax=Prunus yedoensis var. nudiflora TaxID=2094558 RepID=A0A315ALT9_PRUYE|nr:uncharacterized protein Pyn_12665 [Prunus yedoensis var. nudiflora]
MIHLKENEVKLIEELKEPKSASDWNVVDYLVKYVSTPSEERINLPVPPAYLVKPASQGWRLVEDFARSCLMISKGASRIWPGPSDTGGSDHAALTTRTCDQPTMMI